MSARTLTSAPLGRRARLLLLPGLAAALSLSACGSSDTVAEAGGDETGEADTTSITVDGAWARTSPMSATAGAAYMSITAGSDDALVGASVDASIAGEVQIHETTMVDPSELEGDDSMSDDSMSDDSMEDDSMDEDAMDDGGDMGVMQMREVTKIELPAGEAVALAPGGFHVMMLDLPAPLETGQTFDLTLDFENADDMVISVEVRADAPAS